MQMIILKFILSAEILQTYVVEESYIRKGYRNFILSMDGAKGLVSLLDRQKQQFIFISGKDVDFHLAVNSQSLFIVPDWIPNESSARKYGVVVDTPLQLFKFIKNTV